MNLNGCDLEEVKRVALIEFLASAAFRSQWKYNSDGFITDGRFKLEGVRRGADRKHINLNGIRIYSASGYSVLDLKNATDFEKEIFVAMQNLATFLAGRERSIIEAQECRKLQRALYPWYKRFAFYLLR